MLLLIGSILQGASDRFRGIILGSGLISERHDLRFPHANILALRGELTKRCLGIDGTILLGDPGLLASDLMGKETQQKRAVLGIVPHYVDKQNLSVRSLATRYSRDVLVVDVCRHPRAVIRDIARCQYILSSSLHGVIVADALGIPNSWTVLSDRVLGNGFKFRDYYSAFAIERAPCKVHATTSLRAIVDAMQSPPAIVGEVQQALRSLLIELRCTVPNWTSR
ncbi:MAG: polysaccharide pyruvyl transferase family protein [Pirellulaceae bacterium]